MKKQTFLLTAALTLTIFSCTKQKKVDEFNPAFLSARAYEKSSLVLNPKVWELGIDSGTAVFDHEISSGNSTILQFSYHARERKELEDDEVVETFLIELDSNLDSLHIKDKQFNSFTNVYRQSCFSMDCNKGLPTETGYIKGKKLDNKSWWFEVEVGMISFQDTVFINKETRKAI
ncbi:hypothetical protein I5M27_07925 [Adhaeribacter sp. BT258]|uniref:Lipoprotein n=1 Tax=Adhaeribacter terrigena TaxID=2793070 RepID=A0ABS1C0J2_9BACT|nr:hypothetical protein [Adhaeribacter terrigena]MBK0402911.1 hypothetical protein [Adhaeribacter terrigena]